MTKIISLSWAVLAHAINQHSEGKARKYSCVRAKPCLQCEFQANQRYTEKFCLPKQNKAKTTQNYWSCQHLRQSLPVWDYLYGFLTCFFPPTRTNYHTYLTISSLETITVLIVSLFMCYTYNLPPIAWSKNTCYHQKVDLYFESLSSVQSYCQLC